MNKEHLLDLSDFKRDTVKLPDGSTVELHNPNELGPLEEFKLRGLIKAIADYDPSQIKTEEDAENASTDLHALAAMIVVDCPDGLDDRSCAAIFGVWIEKHVAAAADPPRRPRRPQDRKPKTSTGAKSSRASKPSTAATPKRGSTSRSGR